MTGKQIAEKTLEYLGGQEKIAAMVDGNYFSYNGKDGTLYFRFKGNRKMNAVEFALTPKDLYKVTFYKYNPKTYEHKTVEEYDDIYADQLKDLFERITGLYLSL